MATWRAMLEEEGVKLKRIVQISCDGEVFKSPRRWPKAMTKEFYDGYGTSEGCHFTLWTDEDVWFPVVYDGSEWVGKAPRKPCDDCSTHHGGR